ncbi:DUF2520 domain-containing protein [bacterium]|nr:DUF2520 domain-containing protein [bacterium]
MLNERKVVIIGAGMAGRSLAHALASGGVRVAAVASRRPESARACADAVGCRLATTDVAEAARAGDVVVLSVPDDAIGAVCERVASGGGFAPGDVAVHLSGALGSDALEPARAAGAAALAFHPVQSFAHPDGGLFRGIVCTLEGDAAGVAVGQAVACAVGARAVVIPREGKMLYHAALCMASNYTVALADGAVELLRAAGLGERALDALLPLLGGTVDNLARVGLPGALTGPISRGDAATVRAHLDALAEASPGLVALYQTVGLRAVAVALRKGGIDGAQADAMRELLGGRGS